jgi:hypothetical protein
MLPSIKYLTLLYPPALYPLDCRHADLGRGTCLGRSRLGSPLHRHPHIRPPIITSLSHGSWVVYDRHYWIPHWGWVGSDRVGRCGRFWVRRLLPSTSRAGESVVWLEREADVAILVHVGWESFSVWLVP